MAEVNPAGLMFGPKRVSGSGHHIDGAFREGGATVPVVSPHALDKYPDLKTSWIEL
ncbi:hypothetical protein [Actinomadura napierensis]|uniref:Uncharacterized protein n=1 Tax=Actinomadura napierensis TaxID=267854 RepID=A0ABP5LK68_9ACTN